MVKFLGHSVSKKKCYDKCPAQFFYRFHKKLPEPPSPAMERGKEIHKACEDYILGRTNDMTAEMRQWGADMFKELRKLKPLVECKLAYDQHWHPLNNFFDHNAWVRVVFDVARVYDDRTGILIDHKTGKRWPADDDFQMKVFGLAFLKKYDWCMRVETRLWYLDSGEEVIQEFHQGQTEVLRGEVAGEFRKIERDTEFLPNPGRHCQWCAYSRSAGGPCRYG